MTHFIQCVSTSQQLNLPFFSNCTVVCLAYTDVRDCLALQLLGDPLEPAGVVPAAQHVVPVGGTDLFSSEANFPGARLVARRHANILAVLDGLALQLALRAHRAELLAAHLHFFHLARELFLLPPVRRPPVLVKEIQPPARQTVVFRYTAVFVETG